MLVLQGDYHDAGVDNFCQQLQRRHKILAGNSVQSLDDEIAALLDRAIMDTFKESRQRPKFTVSSVKRGDTDVVYNVIQFQTMFVSVATCCSQLATRRITLDLLSCRHANV